VQPSTAPPLVSLVTTVLHADPGYFAAAVRSVRAQTFRDFEWVVAENPPYGCVAELLATAPELRVRHVRIEGKVSLAAARNQALAGARGELLAILDADDENAPERLARQVAGFAAAPGLAVLGGALEVIDAGGGTLGYRDYPLADAAIKTAMRRYNPIAQPAVMLRRQAIAAVGGYRDAGEGACEDYELWSRMAQQGLQFANLPEVLVRYRIHPRANKARRLRATLRDTLRVKREFWQRDLDLGDRLRVLGERALLLLPPALVTRLFLRSSLQRRPPGVDRV
jgi:glycosyltransferase involved in cell wall biosynthesis